MKSWRLALSVGILAAVYVFSSISIGTLSVGPISITLHAWTVFITWALFFAAGANNEAALKVATTAVWGPVWGYAVVFLGATTLGPVIGVPLGLGVAVFIFAAAIVIMMTDIPFFSFGPGAFAGWAVFFGTTNDLWGSIVTLLIGVGLGMLSVRLPNLFEQVAAPSDTSS